MKDKTTAGQTAKPTAKKAASKQAKKAAATKDAVTTPAANPTKVKCRVLKQLELGEAIISSSHPEPVMIEAKKADILERKGIVKIVGA